MLGALLKLQLLTAPHFAIIVSWQEYAAGESPNATELVSKAAHVAQRSLEEHDLRAEPDR